jgi:glutathione S-transferase
MYYEDQKEESLRRSKEWIRVRLPKHLAYWEKVLKSEFRGQGPWLLGATFTYADLVLFQASASYFLCRGTQSTLVPLHNIYPFRLAC